MQNAYLQKRNRLESTFQSAPKEVKNEMPTLPNSLLLAMHGGNSENAGNPELENIMKSRLAAFRHQIPTAESEADKLSSGITSGTPEQVKQSMGERLGTDFSSVRFHTGESISQKADNIGARAWTQGNDVYFGEGGFHPTVAAHELVHTAQQGAVDSSAVNTLVPMGEVQMMPHPFRWMAQQWRAWKQRRRQQSSSSLEDKSLRGHASDEGSTLEDESLRGHASDAGSTLEDESLHGHASDAGFNAAAPVGNGFNALASVGNGSNAAAPTAEELFKSDKMALAKFKVGMKPKYRSLWFFKQRRLDKAANKYYKKHEYGKRDAADLWAKYLLELSQGRDHPSAKKSEESKRTSDRACGETKKLDPDFRQGIRDHLFLRNVFIDEKDKVSMDSLPSKALKAKQLSKGCNSQDVKGMKKDSKGIDKAFDEIKNLDSDQRKQIAGDMFLHGKIGYEKYTTLMEYSPKKTVRDEDEDLEQYLI